MNKKFNFKDMENVYLGSMGWSYNFWPLYEGVKPSDYLSKYSEYFNSVEVNSTFYRIPRKSTVKNWVEQTPEDFIFTVKLPQSISHSPALRYDTEKLNIFLDNIKPLNKKLGAILVQLPPYLSSEESNQLEILLEKLKDYLVAVEIRNEGWFKEPVYNMLKDFKASLVYVEHPTRMTVEIQTGNFNYIRLEGDRKKINGERGVSEVDRKENNIFWANKILKQVNEGRQTFLYVSKYYSGYPPADIMQIKSVLSKEDKKEK